MSGGEPGRRGRAVTEKSEGSGLELHVDARASRSPPSASASAVKAFFSFVCTVSSGEIVTVRFEFFFRPRQVPTILPLRSTAPGSPTVFHTVE